ncbi:MAG: hypothetical protein ACYDA3_14155 [Gaiellaceae bacterium]
MSGHALEHGSSRSGRWLRERRLRVALWLAVIEAVLAAVSHDVSRWTIIILAVVFVPLYLAWGQRRRDTIRQVTWIAAASQALAVVALIVATIVGFFVLVLAGLFAVIALFLILSDRR